MGKEHEEDIFEIIIVIVIKISLTPMLFLYTRSCHLIFVFQYFFLLPLEQFGFGSGDVDVIHGKDVDEDLEQICGVKDVRSERSCDVRVATWESRRCAKTQSHDVRVGMVRGGGDGGFLGLGFSFVLRSYFALGRWKGGKVKHANGVVTMMGLGCQKIPLKCHRKSPPAMMNSGWWR